jgi:hypothetical protein
MNGAPPEVEDALIDAINAKDEGSAAARAAYSKLLLAYYVPLLTKRSLISKLISLVCRRK